MDCKHLTLQRGVETQPTTDGPKSLVVDVWCNDCGVSGTAVIEASDVNWGDETNEEDES